MLKDYLKKLGRRHHRDLRASMQRQNDDIEMIKNSLEKARVVKYIKVVDYHKGMSLKDERPNPISLDGLQARIEVLEKAQKE
jgi:hypothetical protein